ncbi:MAG: hypothetical protein AABY32_06445, partial [Nanoarchaeota archaeon]
EDFQEFGETLKFEGTNLNFKNELDVNGKLELNKYGYIINDGEAVYEGMKIKANGIQGDKRTIILKNYLDEFNYGEDNELNWIKKTDEGIELGSFLEGSLNVEFVNGNEILNVGEHGDLNMLISNGDKINIQKDTNFIPKIIHTNSINGATYIKNDGLSLSLITDDKGMLTKNVDVASITFKKFSSGDYQAVPFVLESEKIEEKIKIDSDGKLSGVLIKFDENKNKIEEKTIYEVRNSVLDLNNEQLESLIGTIKENIKSNEEREDYVFVETQEFFKATKDNGYSNQESLDLATKIIQKTGENSDLALSNTKFGLEALNKLEDKINIQEFSDFTLGNLEIIENDPNFHSLQASYIILEEGLKEKKNLDIIKDLSREVIMSKEISTNKVYFFSDAIGQYDRTNFEDIRAGIDILDKYGVHSYEVTSFLDINYLNIRDTQTLAKEYAYALNKYYGSSNVDRTSSQIASMNLDNIHDIELSLDKTDNIRKAVLEDLGSKAKILMIANSEGTDDLYPSTFEGIYNSLGKDNLVEEIKKLNNEEKYRVIKAFGARSKLSEVYSTDQTFYREIIEEALSSNDNNILLENSIIMSDTLSEIYLHSENYPGEKEKFERFFIEKYKNSEDIQQKATYAYLLKMNKNPVNTDTDKILNEIPEIKGLSISKEIYGGDTIYIKKNHFDDEGWDKISKDFFNKTYGMKIEWEKNDLVRLSKKIEDKKIVIDIQTNSANGGLVESSKEDLKGQIYDLIVMSGHCTHSNQVFYEETSTDSAKIIYDGGCSSYTHEPYLQKFYPNSIVITNKGAGYGAITNKLITILGDGIASEEDWSEIQEKLGEIGNFNLQSRESLSSYVSRYALKR